MLAVNALEEALLWIDTHNPARGRSDERVDSVVEHIATHLAEKLDLPRLADVAHLSPSRLSRLFAEHTGLSPQRFVDEQRMARAFEFLVRTGSSVAQVAADVGYADPFYFSRRLKAIMGFTPRECRSRET